VPKGDDRTQVVAAGNEKAVGSTITVCGHFHLVVLCSAMNRSTTVNSYTMLASTIMIAIAKKLMMLITALPFSQHGEKAPAID
jgi:hypothetical protein